MRASCAGRQRPRGFACGAPRTARHLPFRRPLASGSDRPRCGGARTGGTAERGSENLILDGTREVAPAPGHFAAGRAGSPDNGHRAGAFGSAGLDGSTSKQPARRHPRISAHRLRCLFRLDTQLRGWHYLRMVFGVDRQLTSRPAGASDRGRRERRFRLSSTQARDRQLESSRTARSSRPSRSSPAAPMTSGSSTSRAPGTRGSSWCGTPGSPLHGARASTAPWARPAGATRRSSWPASRKASSVTGPTSSCPGTRMNDPRRG